MPRGRKPRHYETSAERRAREELEEIRALRGATIYGTPEVRGRHGLAPWIPTATLWACPRAGCYEWNGSHRTHCRTCTTQRPVAP